LQAESTPPFNCQDSPYGTESKRTFEQQQSPFGITKMLNPSQEIVDYNPHIVKVYEKHNNNSKL